LHLTAGTFSSDGDSAKCVEHLIEAGADIHALDAGDRTPLHLAAEAGNVVEARILLANGAWVNGCSRSHETPLHVTASAEVAALLIENGALLDAENDFGRTPLDRAVCFGRVDCVAVLIDAGADIEARDVLGNSPLHMAARSTGNPRAVETVDILLKAGADYTARNNSGEKPIQLATNPEVKASLNFYEQRQQADEQRQALAARLAQSSSEAPQQQQVRRRL
jgi:ankyrin repeat protein